MNLASDRLHRARDRLASIGTGLRRQFGAGGDAGPDETDEPADAESAVFDPIDLERAPELVATGNREEMNRAVGWLATAPSIPEDVAAATIEACLDRIGDEAFSLRRLAYRGLAAVNEHHPALVEPHLPTIAGGLGERYIVVRDACAELLVDACRRSPGLIGLVYPYLDSEHGPTRSSAFQVVLDVGREHPTVLCSIDPFLRRQLEDPDVPRPQLVEGYRHRHRRDPDALGDAVPYLVDWLPTTDRDLEEAIVRALTTWGNVPDEGADRVMRTFLSYLASGDRPHRLAASRWIVAAATVEDDLRSVMEAWRDDTDEWERLRVAAAIDEATDDGIDAVGEHLVLPDDTFASDLGIASSSADDSESSV